MSTRNVPFDGLAEPYDQARPRYPMALFTHAVELLAPDRAPVVVDAGAGTGIALETLIPLLPDGSVVHAVDISEDMVRVGKRKFPRVQWHLAAVEDYLRRLAGVALVVAAQAYQWMDRPKFLRNTARCLRGGGVCLIVQNNRHHEIGGFAAEYEDLLEEFSPGYSRSYRALDVERELGEQFPTVHRRRWEWSQSLMVDEFISLSSSSTQAQRAIAAVGEVFLDRVRALCERHLGGGAVHVPYVSEGYYGIVPFG
ncbi:MAG: class I SAM-dependent methyltransferase [Mycobacterium sp.]|nr:class I SAM-dependent methyltransferase [Mycobacterium sp.]